MTQSFDDSFKTHLAEQAFDHSCAFAFNCTGCRAELLPRNLIPRELHRKRVHAIAALVIHAPRQPSDKADAQAARFTVFKALPKVRVGNLARVERMSIIENLKANTVCQAFDPEGD